MTQAKHTPECGIIPECQKSHTNASFTPGPWEVIDGTTMFPPKEALFVQRENGLGAGDVICRAENYVSGRPINDEDRANARLIAAAPDLLDACIEALALFDNHPEIYVNVGTYQVLNAAINKARGE